MNAEQMIEYLRRTHYRDLHQDYIDHICSYDHWELSNIRINSLNSNLIDIDQDKLNTYSRLWPSTVPPIVVADGVILDGYHRVTVAKTQGKKFMTAWIGRT